MVCYSNEPLSRYLPPYSTLEKTFMLLGNVADTLPEGVNNKGDMLRAYITTTLMI